MSKAVGIDLGNTHSVVAFQKTTGPVVLSNRYSFHLIPSVVYLDESFQPVVGEPALLKGGSAPQHTVFSIKPFLGRDFDDPAILGDIRRAAYKVVRAANGECEIELRGSRYTPVELAAFILKSLKEDAEAGLDEEVSQAVLTLPSSAGMRQREALHAVGRLAGLKVTRLLPEPSAAALVYYNGKEPVEPRTVLVYTMGGSSFSATVMLLVTGIFQQLGNAGDLHLGGDAFDQAIMDWVLAQIRSQHRIDLGELPNAAELLFRLKIEAEKAKIRLCRNAQPARILIPDFFQVGSKIIDIDFKLTTAQFERMIQPDIDRSLNLVQAAMHQAQVDQEGIDTVLLVGGSTQMPLVRQNLQRLFGDKVAPNPINPMHCGALGATILATADDEKGVDETFLNCASRPIGVQLTGDAFEVLLPGTVTYPMAKPVVRRFQTSAPGQRLLTLPLYEGVDSRASQNQYLGQVQLGLPPDLPAGTPVEVAFSLDADGILSATARLPSRPDAKFETQLVEKRRNEAPPPSPSGSALYAAEAMKIDPPLNATKVYKIEPLFNATEARQFENDEWISQVEFQYMQAKWVMHEAEGFIPAGQLDHLAFLTNALSTTIKSNDTAQVRQLSAQLQYELDQNVFFISLAMMRIVSQNQEIQAKVGAGLMQQLIQAVKRIDAALQARDQFSLPSVIEEGERLFEKIVTEYQNSMEISSDITGRGYRETNPMSLYSSGGSLGATRTQKPPVESRRETTSPVSSEKPLPPRRPEVPDTVDKLHFSVTSPPSVQPGCSFVVDLWAHLEQQRHEVIQRAKQAVSGREILIKTKGPLPVGRGTVLTVNLKIAGLLIEDPEDTILWEGEIGSASFAVQVPPGAAPGVRLGRAAIYANSVQVGRLNFELTVGVQLAEAQPLHLHEKYHHTAFASYASADRDDVLRCIQGMEKAAPSLNIFVDVHSLRSGQNWEQELWTRIPACDVFFLFWSTNAMQSPWVEKEWRCALSAHGLDFIDPVPLQPPDVAPPPPELAGLHFNDWELAYQRSIRK